jgi:anti-sigma factor RsiW
MHTHIHDHIGHWLESSLKGRLSSSQRRALRHHLAECPACQRAACEPGWVSRAEGLLARRALVAEDLEAQVVRQLREDSDDHRLRRAARRQRRARIAVRAGLAVALLVLLGVRSLNLRFVREDTSVGRALSAAAQVFLREPRPDTLSGLPLSLGADERRLAVAHQLVKGCVGMLLWLCVLLLGGLTFLDLWRRTHSLSRSG